MPAELEDDGLMDDSDESDDVPSDLEDISGDEAEDVDDDAEPEDQDEQVDEDDAFSLAEGSDAEDLLLLDTALHAFYYFACTQNACLCILLCLGRMDVLLVSQLS